MQISNFTTIYIYAISTLPDSPEPPKPGISSASKVLNGHLAIPVFDVETSVFGTTPDMVAYEAYAHAPTPSNSSIIRTTGTQHGQINYLVTGSLFSSFYERVAGWCETNIDKSAKNWPDIINFCRYVRNAFSHTGMIYFRNNSKDKEITWRGVTIGPSKLGTPLRDFLAKADLIILLIDLDKELDNIGAPFQLP